MSQLKKRITNCREQENVFRMSLAWLYCPSVPGNLSSFDSSWEAFTSRLNQSMLERSHPSFVLKWCICLCIWLLLWQKKPQCSFGAGLWRLAVQLSRKPPCVSLRREHGLLCHHFLNRLKLCPHTWGSWCLTCFLENISYQAFTWKNY